MRTTQLRLNLIGRKRPMTRQLPHLASTASYYTGEMIQRQTLFSAVMRREQSLVVLAFHPQPLRLMEITRLLLVVSVTESIIMKQ